MKQVISCEEASSICLEAEENGIDPAQLLKERGVKKISIDIDHDVYDFLEGQKDHPDETIADVLARKLK